jgi:MYXO-CTERM domain-containing protein
VGGSFSFINGQWRTRLAALDVTTGAASAWDPASDKVVFAVAADSTAVYAGGRFTTMGGEPRRYFARFDLEPASVTVLGLTAERTAAGVRLAWETRSEDRCGAFTVLRCDRTRGDCTAVADYQEVAGLVVPCANAPAGWVYAAVDATAAADVAYSYYLREHESTGGTRDHGPALVGPAAEAAGATPGGAAVPAGAGDDAPPSFGCAVATGAPGGALLLLLALAAWVRRR